MAASEFFSCNLSNNSPVWGTTDLLYWKLWPKKYGGGRHYIQSFKDGWVRHNKDFILSTAAIYRLPPPLLAGVCWIEVGGDPDFIDRVAFEARALDWSGPEWIDRHLTVTSIPDKTSFGAVSMQLRTAAETMGLDIKKMSTSQMRKLANCLQTDVFNIDIVGKHLLQIVKRDGFQGALPNLSEEQIKIIGARYNRGVGLSIDKIKQDTSYGDFILKFWPRLRMLLI